MKQNKKPSIEQLKKCYKNQIRCINSNLCRLPKTQRNKCLMRTQYPESDTCIY